MMMQYILRPLYGKMHSLHDQIKNSEQIDDIIDAFKTSEYDDIAKRLIDLSKTMEQDDEYIMFFIVAKFCTIFD